MHRGCPNSDPVADHQKSSWRHRRDNKEHDEKFITQGLWGVSRHPKYVFLSTLCALEFSEWLNTIDWRCSYVGEVGVWTGMWLLSCGSLRSSFFPKGAWLIAGASPLLTWFLLTRVSGVPPLEVRPVSTHNQGYSDH